MATRTAASPSALPYGVPELTAKQRAKVIAHYAEHPESGHKVALAAAGLHVTKPVARAIFDADDELSDGRLTARKVDEGTLTMRLAALSADPEHKDCFNATRYLMAVVHGVNEKQSLELTGPDGGPMEVTNPDVAAAVDRFTALTDAAIRSAAREPAGDAARRALPPSTG